MTSSRKLGYIAALLGIFNFCAEPITVYAATPLIDLYEKVERGATETKQRDEQRQARFASSAQEKARMLDDLERKIAQEEERKNSLKNTFDRNEDRLSELTTLLDRRIGDLGELFGVFRQTADDTQNLLFDSLIGLEFPERRGIIEDLAESTEVPTIPQMRALWKLLIQEIAFSGQVSRFDSEVIAPAGEVYSAEVTRVGVFNAVSGDKYLSYLPEQNKLAELTRQPSGFARNSAQNVSSSSGSRVDFALDPSRGALLGLLVQSPSLMERVQQGAFVGYVIIAGALLGMLLVLERGMRLTRIQRSIDRQLADLDSVRTDNPLGRILNAYDENQHLDDLETISRKLEVVVIEDVGEISKGLPVIKILATVAPLTGLLGTVIGMIETFQSITLFGTGDPKLMAGGISMALITTVLGLLAAIPLLISHTILSSKAAVLAKIVGEQAAGVMAQKAEQLAVSRATGG